MAGLPRTPFMNQTSGARRVGRDHMGGGIYGSASYPQGDARRPKPDPPGTPPSPSFSMPRGLPPLAQISYNKIEQDNQAAPHPMDVEYSPFQAAMSKNWSQGFRGQAGRGASFQMGPISAPQNSSTQPIMTTSQRRLLAGAGQVAPPRPEDDTRTLLQNGTQPGMHGAGDKLNGGSLVVMKNGVPGLAPPQEYTDNTGAFNESQRRAFLDNNQRAAAARGLVQGNTGEWLPRQANGGPNAAQREQQRHAANAVRALNYIDPLTYNAMGNGLGYSPATGLGGYQGQVAYQQNMQRNAQIPWVQQALGGLPPEAKQMQQIGAKNRIDDLEFHRESAKNLETQLGEMKQRYSGFTIPWPWMESQIKETERQMKEHQQHVERLGAGPNVKPASAPIGPRPPQEIPRDLPRQNAPSGLPPRGDTGGEDFPSFPKHEPKDNAAAPNLGNATPLPPLTSTSNERVPTSFLEKLQMMSGDKKAEVSQMVEAGIPVQKALEHAAPELFPAEAKKPVGKSQNVARATIKSKPQGLRRPTQPKTWMQTFGLA